MNVEARTAGVEGNNLTTSTTSAGATWTGTTLGNGASEYFIQVDLPDSLPALSVAFISGFVIVVAGQVDGFKGRWFFIEPGETSIRPENFFTAERSADPLYSVRVIGDQFWLFGTNSTEVWYPTGNFDLPFSRVQGQVFDRGVVQNTDVQIKNAVIVVDTDGVVYKLSNGEITRLSNHATEERIRLAIRNQDT
jgi:hypothetical protein